MEICETAPSDLGAPLRSVTLPEKRHLATDGVLQAGAAAASGWEGEGEEIGAAAEGEHIQTRRW